MNELGVNLYQYKRRLDQSTVKLNEDSLVCDENKQAIVSFSKVRLAKGSSHGRVAKIVYCLRFLAHWLKKPYSQATKDDLISLIGDLESNTNYSDNTKHDYKIVLKMFYRVAPVRYFFQSFSEIFLRHVRYL